MANLDDASALIIGKRSAVPPERAVLVAISGIDGSGKGYITEKLVAQLGSLCPGVVSIHADGWLNLPALKCPCFSTS